jgi:putative aldouronate transport system permease protein
MNTINSVTGSLKTTSYKVKNSIFFKRILSNWQLYTLIIIPFIYIIIFKYGPMYGAQIAFRDFNVVDGITGSKWVGFNHFRRFFDSPIFRRVLFNTLGLSLYNLIAAFPFPILLALGLNYVNNRLARCSVLFKLGAFAAISLNSIS